MTTPAPEGVVISALDASEELSRDAPALVLIEAHRTNSITRAAQPVVGDSAMSIVRGDCRRRRQLPNCCLGRSGVVSAKELQALKLLAAQLLGYDARTLANA
ncbi:hypothetical protein HT746_07010 [Burkholderia pyrrocinia]|uniref:hypothetical protein n=1 Tax=Burkholderia pyrrocinia TaxID=60550 RepID=UPI001576BBC7|nr:hypothetical protein [Burkholderia pyrrocinia]NTX26884.1 hypothetical protein [Burkholderia pyrrocinia]